MAVISIFKNATVFQISDILSLINEQKNQLFDGGLDAIDGSRIDNLGLASQYKTANSYTSVLYNQSLEALSTVIIQTSGTGQKAINPIVLHGWGSILIFKKQ